MKALLKGLAKIAAIIKSVTERDIGNGKRRAYQTYSCLFQPVRQNVIRKRAAKRLFEQPAKIAVCHIQLSGNVTRGDRR